MKRVFFLKAVVLITAVVVGTVTASPAMAGVKSCDKRLNSIDELMACVTLEDVREHQAAFKPLLMPMAEIGLLARQDIIFQLITLGKT